MDAILETLRAVAAILKNSPAITGADVEHPGYVFVECRDGHQLALGHDGSHWAIDVGSADRPWDDGYQPESSVNLSVPGDSTDSAAIANVVLSIIGSQD
jgi:hypothetical protein